MANLGHKVCDQTVGNVLQRHALPPAPARKRMTSWPAFIRIHLALLAGTDFLSAEVLTLRGLVTYYMCCFSSISRARRVDIAGITVHPDKRWMIAVIVGSNRRGSINGKASPSVRAFSTSPGAKRRAPCRRKRRSHLYG